DHVRATPLRLPFDDFDEVLLGVIDRPMRADLNAGFVLSLAARGCDDASAEGPSAGDRGGSDPARATVDEQRLARLEAAALEHVGPHREHILRERGGFDVAPPLWYREHLEPRRDAIFSVSP